MENNINDEAEASLIWDAWGRSDVEASLDDELNGFFGLNEKLGQSLARILSTFDVDRRVSLSGLVGFIRVLRSNSLEERVRLLFEFMDIEGVGRIEPNVMKKYLSMVDETKIGKIGCRPSGDEERSFTYEDLLEAIRNSARGEEAIGLFCKQVLRLLLPSSLEVAPSVAIHPSAGFKASPPVNLYNCMKDFLRKSSSKEFHYLFALVLLQMMFWLIHFFHYRSIRHMPLSFCIAKGFGLNLRVITIALYGSMMRRTMGYLYLYSGLRSFLPLGINIQVHSFLGFCMLFHAFGHMFGHIAYYERHVKGGFAGAFHQESILRTQSWIRRGKGDAITGGESVVDGTSCLHSLCSTSGYILLVSLLLMAGTAVYRGKSSSHFRTFFLVHYLYNLWPVFIFLHVPDLWPYFVAITGAIVLERAYDFFYMTIFSTLSSSRACSNGVTFLSVPRGRLTYPGCFYRIKVPAISRTEWHPFSLAGSISSHHLTFFVSSVGDWTHALYQIVSDPVLRETTMVQVQGPFAAPAQFAAKFSTTPTLLVASGIGITPFFSLIATKVADELNFESDKEVYQELFREDVSHRRRSVSTVKALQNLSLDTIVVPNSALEELRVVWMIRDCGELLFYLDYVHQLVKSQNSLSRHVVYVDVYLTGLGKSSDPVYMIAQTLFMLTVSDLTSTYMNIHFGRPDLAHIIKESRAKQVYYCGGVVLKALLTTLCQEAGAQFYPEDCGSSTTFISTFESFLSGWRMQVNRKLRKLWKNRSARQVASSEGETEDGV